MCHVDKTTASVCVYLYVLVLQTIQIYRTFYVFHRFACDLNLSKIQSFLQICMGSKPVAYFAFPTCLNAMKICCLIHTFMRFPHKANQ